jgi:hypothetical protein
MKTLSITAIILSITAMSSYAAPIPNNIKSKQLAAPTTAQVSAQAATSAATSTTKDEATDTEEVIPTHLDKATSTKICEDVKSKIDIKVAALNEFTDNEKSKVGNVIDKLDKIKIIADDKLSDEELVAEVQDRQDNVSDLLNTFVSKEQSYVAKISDIKKINCAANLKDAKKKIDDSRIDHKSLVSSSDNLHDYISKDVKDTIDKVKDSLDKNKGIFDKLKSFISGN